MKERRRSSPALGSDHRTPAVKRLSTSYDAATFARIRELALTQQTSVAEQIRQLVEFGLETLKLAEDERSRV